jgi:hypothetical protein
MLRTPKWAWRPPQPPGRPHRHPHEKAVAEINRACDDRALPRCRRLWFIASLSSLLVGANRGRGTKAVSQFSPRGTRGAPCFAGRRAVNSWLVGGAVLHYKGHRQQTCNKVQQHEGIADENNKYPYLLSRVVAPYGSFVTHRPTLCSMSDSCSLAGRTPDTNGDVSHES